MADALTPKTAEHVEEAVQWALGAETPLEVVGAGSKRAFGRPGGGAALLDLSALSGIALYEPEELVMTAGAATPIAEIDAALAENRQQLDFEPADLGPLWGGAADQGTIGGAIASNLSGPRRFKAGSARDHILGFKAVSGRGEAIKSGGRVIKNVTGFDLCKLMTGSFGTLAVLTEVTFKVLPAAETSRTIAITGTSREVALDIMTKALQSPFEVSAAAHLTAPVAAGFGGPATLIRLEGHPPSVEYRCQALRDLLAGPGDAGEVEDADSRALWRQVRDASLFDPQADNQIWRLSVPPSQCMEVAEALERAVDGSVYFDWGGGLLWLEMAPRPDAAHREVRRAAGGGHATLVRAGEEVRASVPVFHPQPAALAALGKRIKESFDPKRILNPGRMVQDH